MPLRPVIVSMSPLDYPSAWLRPRSAASVLPGKIIVSIAATSVANFRLRRDSIRIIETPRYAPDGAAP
jgi:hypothetical protein